jgi:electron transfer flavoprotein alpha subunit
MDVLIVAEILDGQLRKSTLSAVRFAQQVASGSSGSYDIAVVGDGADAAADQAAKYGARKVIKSQVDGGYVAEKIAPTLAQIARDGSYGVVVAAAGTTGKDLMPRLAARLGAGIASDIASVNVDGGKLVYRRPMYAGNIFGYCTVETSVQVVTVRQTEFEAVDESGGGSAIDSVDPVSDPAADRIEFVSMQEQKSERPELTEADIVVSGGRALKSSDNFKSVLEPLVDALGAAMGASRAACDAGYVPKRSAGRPDRQGRRAQALHRRRHQRRHPAPRRHEGQ